MANDTPSSVVFKRTISNDSSIAKKTQDNDDDEEGLLYDGD